MQRLPGRSLEQRRQRAPDLWHHNVYRDAWYAGRVMTRWNAMVAVIVVVVLGLAAPLAMASDNCMAMGAMCEGPCGASSCAAAQLGSEIAFDQTTFPATPWVDHAFSVPLTVRKHPPKSSPSLA